jgi:protein farnesyltransferase subunit beta
LTVYINYFLSGGPGQIAHLAPTYAAVNALCLLRNEKAYKVINRYIGI